MRATPRWLRHRLPALALVLMLAWIIMVIVLITLHPVPGTGNPMN